MFKARSAVGFVAAAALAFSPSESPAAALTDVADAMDTVRIGGETRDDAFDLNLTLAFESIRDSGKITREPFDRLGIRSSCTAENVFGCIPVDELEYVRSTDMLRLEAEVGLYEDLSVALGWTYVLGQDLRFRYADRVDASNSSIDPQSGDPNDALFANDFEARHRGAGPLDLTLRWAPYNETRDSTKPTWLLYFTWTIPWTASVFDPVDRATPSNPGPVGDGVHRLTFGTAFSKRIGNFDSDLELDPNANRRGYLDPYFSVAYVIPIPQSGFALDDLVENRENPFGERPSTEVTASLGMEVVPYEDLREQRKVAIDIGLDASLFTEGRNYSLLTDPLGELTFEEQHGRIIGRLGVNIQAAEYLTVRGAFTVGFVTEHFLTFESPGQDLDGDGEVRPNTDDEVNPFFCGFDENDRCATRGFEIDQVGFRFKDEEHLILGWTLSLIGTF